MLQCPTLLPKTSRPPSLTVTRPLLGNGAGGGHVQRAAADGCPAAVAVSCR